MAKATLEKKMPNPLLAGVGATDLAVKYVRGAVSNTQQAVKDLDLKPQALRDQAVKQAEGFYSFNASLVNGAYDGLVSRGQQLVGRVRRQKSTQDTVKNAGTTTAKAKTTKTQAEKKASATKTAAKQAAKKTAAKKTGTKSSAKATTTAAKKTASSAAKATTDAAAKVGS